MALLCITQSRLQRTASSIVQTRLQRALLCSGTITFCRGRHHELYNQLCRGRHCNSMTRVLQKEHVCCHMLFPGSDQTSKCVIIALDKATKCARNMHRMFLLKEVLPIYSRLMPAYKKSTHTPRGTNTAVQMYAVQLRCNTRCVLQHNRPGQASNHTAEEHPLCSYWIVVLLCGVVLLPTHALNESTVARVCRRTQGRCHRCHYRTGEM